MRAWSRSIAAIARAEAQRLMTQHGPKALEFARREARRARDQRNHRLARQYALVAAYIADQSKFDNFGALLQAVQHNQQDQNNIEADGE